MDFLNTLFHVSNVDVMFAFTSGNRRPRRTLLAESAASSYDRSQVCHSMRTCMPRPPLDADCGMPARRTASVQCRPPACLFALLYEHAAFHTRAKALSRQTHSSTIYYFCTLPPTSLFASMYGHEASPAGATALCRHMNASTRGKYARLARKRRFAAVFVLPALPEAPA